MSTSPWQLPDAWAFIEAVPRTSVGKFDKKVPQAVRRRRTRGRRRGQGLTHNAASAMAVRDEMPHEPLVDRFDAFQRRHPVIGFPWA